MKRSGNNDPSQSHNRPMDDVDPTPHQVATAIAVATLECHVEVAGPDGPVCAVCKPVTTFPCENVVLARKTLSGQ